MFIWQDLVEIGFFSACFYYTSRWLAHDHQKNLILPFYAYWGLIFFSYAFEFSAISTLLLCSAPFVGTIFVVIHKHTLQRNFISLSKISPQALKTSCNWTEEVTRTLLYALNKQCDITIVIQHTQSLESFIKSPFRIDTEMQKGLLESFVHEHKNYTKDFFWITSAGKLITTTGSWDYKTDNVWFTQNSDAIASWQQDALLFTAKTDAIVIHSQFQNHTVAIVAQGKLLETATPTQIQAMLQKLTSSQTTKEFNEVRYKTTHSQQSQP